METINGETSASFEGSQGATDTTEIQGTSSAEGRSSVQGIGSGSGDSHGFTGANFDSAQRVSEEDESGGQTQDGSEGRRIAQADGSSVQEGAGEGGAGLAQSPYAPNYKFKVKDKELEFDDFLKPWIKDQETEKKLRDIYEKAHGLEEVKSSREAFKKQVEEWQGKYQGVEQSLQTLGQYVKKGDFRTFFEALNIPKEKIINYAIEELKYQELPAEQREAIEAQRRQQMAYEQAQVQNQSLHQQMEKLVQQQTTFELNQELAKPDIALQIQSYDARVGKPGAFQAEVVRRGQYYEAVHKISPPASQLVEEVLSLIGVQAQAQSGNMAPSNASSSQTVQAQAKKPVIPSFQGSGAKSPARKVPTSIEDLRRMREQL